MWRLRYHDMIAVTEWFEFKSEAEETASRLNLKEYAVQFIGFPFTLSRHSVGPTDKDSEIRHILHWLNDHAK